MKIRCKKCGNVLEGDKRGTFIQCECKSCYIDETEHYCRIGGSFNDIEAVIDFSEYNEIRSKEQIKQLYKDVCKLEENEYSRGFKDALKMILNKEGE